MNILARLDEISDVQDLGALDTLVESLTPAELDEYRESIAITYEKIYSYGMYDLACDKVSNPEDFAFFLLDVIASAQRLSPERGYHKERGYCYEKLSALTEAHDDKVRYIEEAIQIYNAAPQNTEMRVAIIDALLERMELTKQFTTEAFTELLYFYRPVLSAKDIASVESLIYANYKVLGFDFEQNEYWHQRLTREFEGAMHPYGEENLLVYLKWAETFMRMLDYDRHTLTPERKANIIMQTISLIQPLEDYFTEETEILNRLGRIFEQTAEKTADMSIKLNYYRVAVEFFTKGHILQPAAWTFPVYATGVLLEMAKIYNAQGSYEKMLNTFEHGQQLFSQVYQSETDFTLTLNWARFSLQYTKMAFDYKSASVNKLVEEKCLLAIQLGNHAYTQPYLTLAKLMLKTGNKERCMEIMKECKQLFTYSPYYSYDFREVREDEEFKDIWGDLDNI
jgi:hypothetical protein